MAASAKGGSTPLLFRVKVGGRTLSKPCSWSDVEKFKEKVKVFCRWNAQEKVWVASIESALKHSNEALEALREIYGPEGAAAASELLRLDRELRERELKQGNLLLLPSSDCPLCWRLLRRCSEKREAFVGGERVTYVRVDLDAAYELVLEWGSSPETVANALLELLATVDPLLTPGQQQLIMERATLFQPVEGAVAIRELGMRGAVVVMPQRLNTEEVSRIEAALTVNYYRQGRGPAGIELVPHRLKLVKLLSSKVLKVPYALIPELERLLGEIGYKQVVEEVSWPLKPPLSITPKFNLYSFQEEALEAWLRAGSRGAIVMPTGAGKTYVALAAISRLRIPTLICVTTVELAKQWVRRIQECLGTRAGILAGGEKRVEPITVATYPSAVKALHSIYDKFGFVVFDEGHHLPAETFKEIALHLKAKHVMVLSATPERADGNEALIYAVSGKPVYKTSYYELVVRGLLAPLQLETIPVELSNEEAMEYARLNEPGDPSRTAQLIRVAAQARAKLDALREIISSEKGKIIVFCQFIDQAREAYKFVKEIEPRAALITGATPKGERLRALENFKRGTVRVLVATTVLDEGVDVPDADVAVILSGTGQVRQMVQRVGRVLRWTPGKVAKVYEVIAAGTVEEALSRSRSLYKLIDRREVEAALEVAQAAYGGMAEIIERYYSADQAEKEKLVEEARAIYVKFAAEVARRKALLEF